ncbi:MAG: hypothetical protein Alpg2KO_32990 [Alphaproteobacteria bacterium]
MPKDRDMQDMEAAGRGEPALQQETFILNIDYCGNCRGVCPSCILTADERARTTPFLTVPQIADSFARYGDDLRRVKELIIGVGRGNILTLDPRYDDDLVGIARAAEQQFAFEGGVMELSTSLVGKYDHHVARAKSIVKRFAHEGLRFDPRFVVVANTAIDTSPNYWRNIRIFCEQMQDFRGGGDGAGDILLLNLNIANLPDIDMLRELLAGYRFPVNITWTPWHDPDLGNDLALRDVETWLAEFYALAMDEGLDSNVINYTHLAMDVGALTPPQVVEHIENSGESLAFIDQDGVWHKGSPSVVGDLDPVRYWPKPGDGAKALITDAKGDFATLFRARPCRACAHVTTCVTSGAWHGAMVTCGKRPELMQSDLCPAGTRSLFSLAQKRYIGDTNLQQEA